MPHDEPSLFDLPLVPAADEPADPPRRAARPARAAPAPRDAGASGAVRDPRARGAGELPLFPAGDGAAGDEALEDEAFGDDAGDEALPRPAPARPARETAAGAEPAGPQRGAALAATGEPAPAGWPSRVLASLADGAFLGAALVGGGLAAALLGVWPGAGALVPLALFALVFSFVYSVVPLAFWGRTPGMAVAGLVSRDADGGPLTFGQTGLRWLGGLLTLAAAGFPLFLALGPLGGRSLADRLSGSRTWAAERR